MKTAIGIIVAVVLAVVAGAAGIYYGPSFIPQLYSADQAADQVSPSDLVTPTAYQGK